MQVVPLQQPLGHDDALQTHCPLDVLQVSPPGHASHAAPPEPHDVDDSLVSASHVEPLQQPAHVPPPPHVHCPLEHVSPIPQVVHVAPPVPHSPVPCEA
jgi:hypothetical protein